MDPTEVTREKLHAYLDDALSMEELASLEKAMRDSPELLVRLNAARDERDRGEHTLGGIWREERLTCPTRADLSDYLLECLSQARIDYIRFHLNVIACPFCLANLSDLETLHTRETPAVQERQQRMFDSSSYLFSDDHSKDS